MISVLSIVSIKGDILVWEQYRKDVLKEKLHDFIHHILKSDVGSLPPFMEEDGVYCYHIKREKIYFIMITKVKMLDFEAIEFLEKFYCLLGDFCGTVSEETVCRNQILIFELMTQLIDFGYIQLTSVDKLHHLIYSNPVVTRRAFDRNVIKKPGPFGLEQLSLGSSASERPLVKSRSYQEIRESEVFVDIIERLIVHVNYDGSVQRFQVNGCIQLKSFIFSNPDIRLGLNEDLVLTNHSKDVYAAGIYLDQYNFHECVDAEKFEKNGVIVIHPPEGNVNIMTYQMETILPALIPFHLTSVVEESVTGKDIDLLLKLKCNIPNNAEAVGIRIHIPVPSATKSFMQQFNLTGNSAEFVTANREIIWKIKKLPGNSEAIAKFKLVEASQCAASRLQLGPVAIEFEISNFVCSGLKIRFLQVDDHRQNTTEIRRWIRYVMLSDSYIFKI